MAVFRVNKNENYTVISNYHLKDKRLSLKAKGLLTMMLSLKDEWKYSIAGLAAISVEKESAIKSGLNELKEYGYLIVTKLNPSETDSGRFEYIYDIYEAPQGTGKQYIEKQGIENQPIEIQSVENHGQLNTKEVKTNNKNTNKSKTRDSRFKPPTIEEVQAYIDEKGYSVNAERWYAYYESNGWMVGRNKMKAWKASIQYWNSKNKKGTDDGYISEYDDLF